MADIGRFLVVYDGASEEVEDLFEIKDITLADLKEAFDVPDTDPEMHGAYPVGPEDIAYVQELIGKVLDFDFTAKAYMIEAVRKDI